MEIVDSGLSGNISPTPDESGGAGAAGEEQRIAIRHLTSAHVAILHAGPEDNYCRVRNISQTGLMAHVYRRLEVGEEVSIELRSGHVVQGKVSWATEHMPELASRIVRRVGIRFSRPVDVGPLLSGHGSAGSGRIQRWARINLRCPLRLSIVGRQVGGTLCDISQRGAKIRTSHGVARNGRIGLLLRGFPPIYGAVRWAEGPISGIEFDDAVKLEPLADWIHDCQSAAGTEPADVNPWRPASHH